MSNDLKSQYDERGFLSGIDIISQQQAAQHRSRLEAAEREFGPLHYRAKVHTILRSPYELAVHPKMLDTVERLLGEDILLHNVTYIIKEANTSAYVSWHQDLTYWGLDQAAQVSAWLALSVADASSGCMRMIPRSHLHGQMPHELAANDQHNVLLQGQHVQPVNEQDAVLCPLQPGQASFHHGWLLHSSLPNRSDDRRIGLNIQYIAPHVRQTKLPGSTALLVRGQDRFAHYSPEIPAQGDLEPAALARHLELEHLYQAIAGNA